MPLNTNKLLTVNGIIEYVIRSVSFESKSGFFDKEKWQYDNKQDYEYGFVIGTLASLSENVILQLRNVKTIPKEDINEISNLIALEIKQIKQNISKS